MKFKLTFLLISTLTFSIPVLAGNVIDSIGVENQNGKKIILHKIDPKDNYYAIGRRYNVKPNAIIKFNNNAPMRIGNVIKVPTEVDYNESQQPVATTTPAAQQQQTKPATQPVQQPATQPVVKNNTPAAQPETQPVADANNIPEYQDYKVSAGETLFAIARRFNTTVDDIVNINKLTKKSLTAGQIIKVRANKATTTPVVAPVTTVPDSTKVAAVRDSTEPMPVSTTDSVGGVRPNRYGLYEKNEKGVATWMEEAGLDANKKLVLHRTAPIGTVIKIINPMTNRTTFAKVVGRFTDNESTKDVIIVMTKNVAESLGALDKRFHVNISYGTTNE
ncbi:LysM peptidoglycan-binding domain-containing protein [Mucilaginibacter sp. UR6-1]|uniref:LysM peptidoglycan-binding domain-containing protein n=1 Tax=Mucilaginibacter sp. UR6-1 TaxID=1435643 RepID=UPI001E3B4BA9|nr:LysM peptidoglycan-binding domain-containing protein [Mucilaginibacter sp. UR6-1]MCC8409260.1 LysM peptidoglycan-binding domain-containing protein [Mucilaginibacter sp. UR6-1]